MEEKKLNKLKILWFCNFAAYPNLLGKKSYVVVVVVVLQFTTRRELHTKDHGPDWFRRICSTEIS
jgi:hypothetical protein